MPLLIGSESFMGFSTILPLSGHSDAKDIRDMFPFPSVNSLSLLAAPLNGCTLLGRSPEIFWHDKMHYILRLLFQIPAIFLSKVGNLIRICALCLAPQ